MSDKNIPQTDPFNSLADVLLEAGCSSHPSEIHGLLCGQLAAGLRPDENQWLQEITQLSGNKTPTSTLIKAAASLYSSTLSELEHQDHAFALLLADDDEDIQPRAESLGIWCASFLSGFGERQASQSISADTKEILRDLAEIAQIESAITDDDEAERSFVAISEYVRTTVMLIFLEGHPKPSSSKKKQK